MSTVPMIQKKICMLGSFSVGKTSLVARFVTPWSRGDQTGGTP